MCRISPRRSGLERREESVEPIRWGIAIDERRLSPGAPKAVAQRSTVTKATNLVLPSCPTGLVCVLVTQQISSNCGSARKGLALDRFEPCEAKVSRTVLRGRGRVNRLRLPSASVARVVITPQEFKRRWEKAPEDRLIVFPESSLGLRYAGFPDRDRPA